MKKEGLTNKKFVKEDEKFQEACMNAEIEPTPRQASKYRNKKGKAFKAALQAK